MDLDAALKQLLGAERDLDHVCIQVLCDVLPLIGRLDDSVSRIDMRLREVERELARGRSFLSELMASHRETS